MDNSNPPPRHPNPNQPSHRQGNNSQNQNFDQPLGEPQRSRSVPHSMFSVSGNQSPSEISVPPLIHWNSDQNESNTRENDGVFDISFNFDEEMPVSESSDDDDSLNEVDLDCEYSGFNPPIFRSVEIQPECPQLSPVNRQAEFVENDVEDLPHLPSPQERDRGF